MLKPAITAVAMLLGGAAVGVAVYVQSNPSASIAPRLGAGLDSVTKALPKIESVEVASVLTLDEITVLGVARHMAKARPASLPFLAMQPCSNWWELDPQSNVRMLCFRERD